MTSQQTEKRFNLVLVHTPGWQDVADFQAIASRVERDAPEIRVTIVSNMESKPVVRKRLRDLPTLLFSPVRLINFRIDRGRIYCGRPMSKLDEVRQLAAGGAPVPHFALIEPETIFSQEAFGPLVVVKPTYELAAWGQGIELMPTAEVRYRAPDEFPEGHPGRRGPMIAQKFVDCGRPMSCRVLTFFGETIFTYCRSSTKPFDPDQTPRPYQQTDYMPAMPHSEASMPRGSDLQELGALAYRAMPDVALQACDVMRDRDGKLHLLEVNPGGGTWMFSSPGAQGYRERLGIEQLDEPFNAFEVCARHLVERTRMEAE